MVYVLMFILIASAVSSVMVGYISNSLTATVTVASECNDLVDNIDGDGLIDIDDPNCHTDGDPLNASSYNICMDEVGFITNCL